MTSPSHWGGHAMHKILLLPIVVSVFLSGCVSRGKYDALQAQNWQLQQQNAVLSKQVIADKTQLSRLQRTVKSTASTLERLSGPADKAANGHSPEEGPH